MRTPTPRALGLLACCVWATCSSAYAEVSGLPRLPDEPHPRELREDEVTAASVAAARLVDGGGILRGRLELQIGGSWGAVCSAGFGVEEARVACRQMGLTGGAPARTFPQGKLLYVVSDVQCRGGEAALAKCKFRFARACPGGKAIGVVCQKPAILAVRLADGSSPAYYAPGPQGVASASAASLNPYTPDAVAAVDVASAHRNLLSVSSPYAPGPTSSSPYTPLSPSPSPSPYFFPFPYSPSPSAGFQDGRVEVQLTGGRWGTVCDTGFGDAEAQVVCRMTGRSGGRAKRGAPFGPGTVPVRVSAVKCKGTEANLTECQYSISANPKCTHAHDVGVECSTLPKVPVRLANGKSTFKGRLEVKIGGRWGTVCGASGFNDAAAGVVCGKLGLSRTGKARPGGSFGPGKLPIMMTAVRCKGGEAELSGCTFSTDTSKCKHGQDVGVVCARPTLAHMELTKGDNGFIVAYLSTLAGVSQSRICRDGFTTKEARVACAQAGYAGGEVLPAGKPEPARILGYPRQLNRVRCQGNEVDLAACMYQVGTKCVSGKSAAVRCKEAKLTGVRLVGGKDKYRGRLEVLYGGRWGSVCNGPSPPLFLDAAQTACRQLGFAGGRPADFGPAKTTPILLGNVYCYTSLPSLANCSFTAGPRVKKCMEQYGNQAFKLNPVGVICTKK